MERRQTLERGRAPRPALARPGGWLHINGGYAKGDFAVPAVLADGAIGAAFDAVARVLNLAGGVTCTIAEDAMDRAPAFVFASSRDARAFRRWMLGHLAEIRSAAESKSAQVKLSSIESHVADNLVLIRFDFGAPCEVGSETVARAERAACEFIEHANPTVVRYFLMSAGGRRVVAQAKIAGTLLRERLGIELAPWRDRAVIATVHGGATALLYSDLTPHDELYLSMAIPELTVNTGGDHLRALGCAGAGNANKLAEIVAAAALATSLARHLTRSVVLEDQLAIASSAQASGSASRPT